MTTAQQPGDIMLTQIVGVVGKMVEFGQWLNGDGFTEFEHAVVYKGNGVVIEAEPGGARERNLSDFNGRPQFWSTGVITLTATQRTDIVDAAIGYLRTPYSFLDYDALAAHRLHIPAPGLRQYIANTGHMICSQLADQCYADAGVHLFTDGRWPGYVTPGDLYKRFRQEIHP